MVKDKNDNDADLWLEEIYDVKPLINNDKIIEHHSSTNKKNIPSISNSSKIDKHQDYQQLFLDRLHNPNINIKNKNNLPYDKPTPTLELNKIDATLLRQLRLNRDVIDEKIDLHDMSQSEAYHQLRMFLQNAYNNGAKIALIITGKGSKGEIGELRRNLPRWCIEPNFGKIVVGLQQAYKHHGGDGAFYLQIKKRQQ